jgi:IPT/TIG domain
VTRQRATSNEGNEMNSARRLRSHRPRRAQTALVVILATMFACLASVGAALGAGARFSASLVQPALESTAPLINNVTPEVGPAAGGTTVIIGGHNFIGASAVHFGATPASSFKVTAPSKIEAVTPPGVDGTVDVTVTTPEGTSAIERNDHFSYVAPGPVVLELLQDHGPARGGDSVKIFGAHFTGASEVLFGTAPAASFTVRSDELIEALTPAAPTPTADVRVRTAEGTSPVAAGDVYTFLEEFVPDISGISPTKGPAAGGTVVAIGGREYFGVTGVEFGAKPAAAYTVNSPSSITATAPPDTAEKIAIQIETTFGPSAPEVCTGGGKKTCSVKDFFKYLTPTVESVTPSSGPIAGGTTVTLTGSGFGLGTSETEVFGSKAVFTSVDCTSETLCTAVSPAHKAGHIKVQVRVESNEPEHSKGNAAAEFTFG